MRIETKRWYDIFYNGINELKEYLREEGLTEDEIMTEVDIIISDVSVDVGHYDWITELNRKNEEHRKIKSLHHKNISTIQL